MTGWGLSGVALGMAESIPGISGGTVAILIGVYGRLIRALAAFSPDQLLVQFRQRDFSRMDLPFLLTMGVSMLLAIWLSSHWLLYLYNHFEHPFRLFLALLVFLGTLPLLRQLEGRISVAAGLAGGCAIAVFWTLNWQWQVPTDWFYLVLSGAGGGALMMLPGVSGGYLLLLLGLYDDILQAVGRLDWMILMPFLLGVGLGVLGCARLLKSLLDRFGHGGRAFFIGLILGSLYAILPERYAFSTATLIAVAAALLLAFGLWRISARQGVMLAVLMLAGTAQAEPAGWVDYRIQKGENLSMIANLYNIKASDLIRWNGLKPPYRIFPGRALKMPLGTRARLHRVKKGETLSGVALRYRTFVKRLRELNGLNAVSLIYPGQILRLAPELNPVSHLVVKGENIWGLALRYNLEMADLIRINGLKKPFHIYPGQKLLLAPSGSPAPKTLKLVQKPPPENKKQPPKQPVELVPPDAKEPIQWIWPATGRLLSRFHPRSNKGIDISGRAGEAVRAAASGEVRYAGDGLFRDYGWLIILGHGRYLSVYAHNRKLLVKEGDSVKAGERIAEMGDSGTDRVKLHFQVKFRGRPTDPLTLLPVRRQDAVSESDTAASP